MAIIFFFLLILSSCTSLVLSADENNDYLALLKIKEQLGNPDILSKWVYGFDFCNNEKENIYSFIECTSTSRVKILALFDIYLSTPFPQAICDLTELEHLAIFFIGLYGPIPSCINKLINLRLIDVWRTNLSGPIPEFLNHNNLTQINLSENNLSGSIPPSLSKLPNLQYVNLQLNSLTGTIPPGLVHGPSASLVLNDNGLTGEIPRCYGSVDFFDINLSNNQLSGDASFLFGKHKTVNHIDLSKNQFKFDLSYVEIPENLTSLDLSFNEIYGKVPSSLASAPKLWSLNLTFNKLCGEIPQGGNMWWHYSTGIFVENACLCGRPLPPCYNSAPTPAPLFAPPFDSTP